MMTVQQQLHDKSDVVIGLINQLKEQNTRK